MRANRIIVRGKVQGVSFRAMARQKATDLGIKGYAKNMPDGSVEIVAEGKADAVEAFTAWCYTGPVDAEVKDIYIETMVPREMKGFIVG